MDGHTKFDTCFVPESRVHTALLTIQPYPKATAVCILDRTARVEVDQGVAVGGLDRTNESIRGNRKSEVGVNTRSIEGTARVGMECHRVKDLVMDPLHNIDFTSRWPVGRSQPC